MLILTRKPGERVVIGENVLVTVMGVSGHTVRLGIAAPEGVSIYREEIWLAVKEENRAAAESAAELPDAPVAGARPGGPGSPSAGGAGEAPPRTGADEGPVPGGGAPGTR